MYLRSMNIQDLGSIKLSLELSLSSQSSACTSCCIFLARLRVIGPVGVGVEVGNVVDEVGKVVGVVDDAGVCISRRLVVDCFSSAARPGASARRAAHHAARRAACRRLLRLAQTRRRLLRLLRTSGCLGTSRGSSRGSSRRSSSATPPRAGPSSTTSPPPRVRVPRHVARLVMRLVAPPVVDYSASCRLVVDHSASRRLVVDYVASTARPGASARRATRLADRRAAHRRLLHASQVRLAATLALLQPHRAS
jgi:hypothetical protein